MRKSEIKRSKEYEKPKSSWGGWRPGAGRKKKVHEPSPFDIEFPYEIVSIDTIEFTDTPRVEAQIKNPKTELDRLFNKAMADGGDVKAIKKYLNLTLGRVR